jgi:hypothetical protein
MGIQLELNDKQINAWCMPGGKIVYSDFTNNTKMQVGLLQLWDMKCPML